MLNTAIAQTFSFINGGEGGARDGRVEGREGGHHVGAAGGGRAAPHPPPLEAPRLPEPSVAVAEALADDEAVLLHHGQPRVPLVLVVLVFDFLPLLSTTPEPVHLRH